MDEVCCAATGCSRQASRPGSGCKCTSLTGASRLFRPTFLRRNQKRTGISLSQSASAIVFSRPQLVRVPTLR